MEPDSQTTSEINKQTAPTSGPVAPPSEPAIPPQPTTIPSTQEAILPKPPTNQIEPPHTKTRALGKALAVVFVVIILVIAGLYYWGAQLVKNEIEGTPIEESL